MSADPPPGGARRLSAFVVAGTHSGVGKTTVTLGLVRALVRRGLAVQPFKVGPDFIDPLHHAHAGTRPSRNLDGWMLEPAANRRLFASATAAADVAVIEGVMGLYDGSDPTSDRGSTAEMAKLLDLPVLLVVDAAAMARSAAALIHGYTDFDPGIRFAGAILNNVGSPGHADILRAAITETPVVGALPRTDGLTIPERHLGLHLPHERDPDHADRLADLVEQQLDLDALLDLSVVNRPAPPAAAAHEPRRVRVAVARDEAFCFYYQDNLDLLAQAGAELVPFSPIRDPFPNGVDGLYLGGGYPELHARALAANGETREAIRAFAAAGRPVYAECGGLMYLGRTIEVDGDAYAGCGVLPFGTRIPAPLTLSYAEVTTTGGLFGAGRIARGHVYHHSEIVGEPAIEHCYSLETNRGVRSPEGYATGNVLASYAHLHFASNPTLATAFVDRCLEARSRS